MAKRKRHPLRRFSTESVEYLIEEGVTMIYDRTLDKKSLLGLWIPDKDLVCISDRIDCDDLENVTVIHEWLHAYEDLILKKHPRYKESQIDWWAGFHQRNFPELTDYIRSFFTKEGF